ncbi:hypothetical protein TNIN_119291 [Trichonephila inaurata madagascariensis]|uniref:Uncharacterized protein n=1 Tax=Trichonephila inaurata madagascariensis TaxID=2747483 RepID=A0A8X6IPB6_9ARAC|nr:hypothetical protein TNIN_119291 [Trichonephila inaurata madagascariensis]
MERNQTRVNLTLTSLLMFEVSRHSCDQQKKRHPPDHLDHQINKHKLTGDCTMPSNFSKAKTPRFRTEKVTEECLQQGEDTEPDRRQRTRKTLGETLQ